MSQNTISDTVDGFDRILTISPAWDRRSSDEAKNYGVHGMEIRFVLKGELGAVQFVFYTGIFQKHVADEHKHAGYQSRWMGADIGYHSPKPMYNGHQSTKNPCGVLGGECFYDGSSLSADNFAPTFVERGPDAVWEMLRDEYDARFGEVSR
jgi:hypothetical protein